MSPEYSSKNDPVIAARIRQFRQIRQSEELPRSPIERIAMDYLNELSTLKQDLKNETQADFNSNPLVLALKNGLFIQDMLATFNLEDLLLRTQGRVFLDRDKHLYFGKLPEIKDEQDEDGFDDSEDMGLYLCFDDGDLVHPLTNGSSFQEVWDRGDKNTRKYLANFGRMTKQQIIKRFENFARENAFLNY